MRFPPPANSSRLGRERSLLVGQLSSIKRSGEEDAEPESFNGNEFGYDRQRRPVVVANQKQHDEIERSSSSRPKAFIMPPSRGSLFVLLSLLSLSTWPIPAHQATSTINSNSNQTTTKPNYLETGRQITGILDKFMSLGYDKRVRPNYGGPPVEVNVTMRILSISSVSEVMMDFTADFYFRQTWHDPRLSFKKLGDIQTLYVGAEVSKKIWLPDTFFGNEKLAYFHEATTPNVFLRIDHSGEVYRSIRLTVTSSCPMNLQYFPMDRQRCTIEAESYGYNVKDIIYRWARKETAVERDKEISLPQFDIVKTVQKYRLEELSSGTYSRLIAEIHFARRMGYYLIQIYIPSSLIVVISWVSFWLHRNASPARVQLGVTTVLTMTTLMSSTNAALPKISYVKSIDIFLGTCFIMVFAALLEYATVGYLGKRIAMRKAQVQHAQSQAQARVFAQLQAQGAQGDPVPPSAVSALLGEPSVGGVASSLLQQQQQQQHQQQQQLLLNQTINPSQQQFAAPISSSSAMASDLMNPNLIAAASMPSAQDFAPPVPERNSHQRSYQCHCSYQQFQTSHLHHHNQRACHAHHSCCCSTATHNSHEPIQPHSASTDGLRMGASSARQQVALKTTNNNNHNSCHSCANAIGNTLPSNLILANAANNCDATIKSPPGDEQATAAAVAAKLFGFNSINNTQATGLPPSYCSSKGASAAATAAAATFVNMHRRNKGLPPSTNPNFAQFSWAPQNNSLETIFGIRPSDIDKYSRVVFPVCFVCFQLMYWIVYLHISAFLENEQQQQQATS